jgi:hypothetical protein
VEARPVMDTMPKLKATNAYDLLTQVRELILEEPLRYNQEVWLKKKGVDYRHQFPACGTVGCVAGWVVALVRPGGSAYDVDVNVAAKHILGLGWAPAAELFDGDAVDRLFVEQQHDDNDDDWLGPYPQTAEYAALGAEHILRFQEKYAEQLKAKAIP